MTDADEQREQVAAELIRSARAALDEGGYARCLEILKQAAEIPPTAEAAREIDRLRQAAGEARLRERTRADEARDRAAQGQRSAAAADAERHAPALWNEASAKWAEARATLAREQYDKGAETFDAATALYKQAESQAREVRRGRRERARAEEAGDRAGEGQRRAAAAEADRHAPALWNEASAKSAEAQAALAREQYAEGAEAFDAATALYHQADSQAREALGHQRDQVEQARLTLAERRRSALAADAASHAPSDWKDAEASAASGEVAFARETYTEAGQVFAQAVALYSRAEERAREVIRTLDIARAEAEKGRQAAALAWRAATQAHASKYAAESLRAAENTEAQATAAFNRREYALASSTFAEARRQFTAAAQMASVAADAEARRVEAMMSDARRSLESGDVAACLRQLAVVVALRPGHPAAEELREQAEKRLRQVEAAAAGAEPADHEVAGDGQGNTTAPAPAAPTTVVEPQARDRAVSSVEPARKIPDATGLGPAIPREAPAVTGSPAATRPFAATSGAGDIGSRRDRARAHDLPAASGRRPRPFGTKAAAIVLGGLAAIVIVASVLVIFFRPSGGPPLVSSPAPEAGVPRPVARPAEPASPQAPVTPTSPPRPIAPSPEPPAARTAVDGLRKQALAARDEAARVDTDRLAPSEFAAAAQKMREGDAALDQQDMAKAQQRYREALEGYGLARAEANRTAALTKTLIETRVVASQAADARRAAELVDAPRRAPALWAKASSAQGKAEDALKQGEFGQAQILFVEAEKAYRAAKTAVEGEDRRR